MCSVISTALKAQDNSENKITVSVEADPTTFVLKGYALYVRIKP
jgi:hypothetical protein